jgi:hypothetical protein
LFGLYRNLWNGPTLIWEVNLRLVAFTTGMYAVETAMTGALAPKQSSRCTDIKLFDRAHRCCPPGNMNSKSKRESKLLWQYYRCKVLPWGITLILKTTLNTSAWEPFHVWTWICLFICGFRAAARMRKRDYVMLTSKYSPSWNALLPNRVRGAIFETCWLLWHWYIRVGAALIKIIKKQNCPKLKFEVGHL